MIALRSSGVIGPIRADGGRTMMRSTIAGVPLPSMNETSASPLPNSMMTWAVLSLGLGRNVWAAAATAFWSRGVNARSACCTRLPSWAEHGIRDVNRILSDEINPDALRADQPYHLLDLVHQRLRRIVEQQMRLVEEEHELGFRWVAGLGQFLEQLGQHPQQERRIQPRTLHQFVRGQDIDHAAAIPVGAHEVLQR